jgi:tetratricopeptide (TPR) repeat protein
MTMPRRLLPLIVTAACVCLAGCQELRGPSWSEDGHRVIFTAYATGAGGRIESSVYVLDADDENSEPQLIAKNAAFPQWLPDGSGFFYLSDRDAQGFYTKVCKHVFKTQKPNPEALLQNLRATHLQMAVSGTAGLLSFASEARPGAPVTIELWSAEDNKRVDLRKLGEMYSPALTPNGKTVAYAQKPAELLPLLLVHDLEGAQPKAVFPTPEQNEPNASTYVIHAFPDNERFLFYAPGGANLWSIRKDGSAVQKYPLPPGMSTPVMAAIAEDSSSVCVTLTQAVSEKLLYQVYKLDVKSKQFTKLDGDSTELLGGHVLDSRALKRKGPTRYAWLSSAGLAVGEPQKARYFPMTSAQCLAASGFLIKQNEAAKALSTALRAQEMMPLPLDASELHKAESRAYLAVEKPERAADAFERAVLLHPVGPEGLRLIFPPESGLPRPAPTDLAAEQKEIEGLLKAQPNNKLLPLLRQALSARAQGKPQDALEFYRQGIPLCPDEARVGGVRFLQGLCALESFDYWQAGEQFEFAAKSNGFPHADYAAGLGALCAWLAERPESDKRAGGLLQMIVARNSPLAQEFGTLAAQFQGRHAVEKTTGKEVVSAQGARVWVEAQKYLLPYVFLKPARVLGPDGKHVERRIGLRPVTASAVKVAGTEQPIFRIPREISAPQFSAAGGTLAFAVSGEVFPRGEALCDVFAIDLKGVLLLGSPRVVYSGQLESRQIVSRFEWSGASDLKVDVLEIDVFGGETPKSRTLPVTVRAATTGR